MHKSKLIQALRCLSTKQRTRFGEFLQSPYFNKNEDLSHFYNYIEQYAPRFKHKILQKEKVYKAAFPDRKNDTRHLGYLMSDLLKLLEQFMSHEKLQSEDILPYYYTAWTYNEWGLDKHYKSMIRKAKKQLTNYPYRDTNYYFNKYLLATLSNEFFTKQLKHKYDQTLQDTVDNLDLFFIARKLKYSCEILNRKHVLSADYQLNLINELMEYLNNNPYPNTPAINIYYHILLALLEDNNPEHYEQLIVLLDKYSDQFPKNEVADMYAYAQNYCIRKINKGDTSYLHQLFKLYNTLIKKEIIFEDGHLSPWTYKNIVAVALRLKEFNWTEEFIEYYKEKLHPKFRENAYNFNKASLLYHKRDYKQALQLLLTVEFTDIYYQLNTKLLMLKIYYETDEINALHSLIDSFKAFLRRNKHVSDYRRKTFTNFLKFLRKLIGIPKNETEQLAKLEEEIKSNKEVVNINWLLEKIQEKNPKKRSIA